MNQSDHNTYRLRNPYAGSPTYNCFGCSPDNPVGLGLTFFLKDDVVFTQWEPRADLEGYPGVVHGGIQATLADETGEWYLHAVLGTAGMTREMSVSYHEAARSDDGPFTIEARGTEVTAKRATIRVTISGRSGTLFTTAECVYGVFSEALARKRLGFPGAEAFFEK